MTCHIHDVRVRLRQGYAYVAQCMLLTVRVFRWEGVLVIVAMLCAAAVQLLNARVLCPMHWRELGSDAVGGRHLGVGLVACLLTCNNLLSSQETIRDL